ncbi:MAG: hypothetical protein HUK22_07850, partial [Thermoguttaceae bacterium]|nr:hypothetical protein [Thermoguttaceae bacterium]
MYIETVPNRNSKPAILLREGRRVGGRVVKRTVANLTSLPAEAVEALRLALKGAKLCDADGRVSVESTVPCGHVKAIRAAMSRLGMAELVSSKPCRERDMVLALIAQRLVEPTTKLAASLRFGETTIARDFGVEGTDENDIYRAMDWLVDRQPFIERKLAARHLRDGAMAFYDLSCSSYHGTHCELAKRGYNRDGLKLPAIEYGLLTDAEGRPVSVQVYAGNTGDPKTVPDQAAKLKGSFGLERVVLVGQSYAAESCGENIAKNYPKPIPGAFNVGVLHTDLSGDGAASDYAPTGLETLNAKNYQYWALGHKHQRAIVQKTPAWVVYSGVLQGRHIRETEPKGFYLVEIENGELNTAGPEFIPVDSLRWFLRQIDLSGAETMADLDALARREMQNALADADG